MEWTHDHFECHFVNFLSFTQESSFSQLEINYVIQEPTEANQNTWRPPYWSPESRISNWGISYYKFVNHEVKCAKLSQHAPCYQTCHETFQPKISSNKQLKNTPKFGGSGNRSLILLLTDSQILNPVLGLVNKAQINV